MPDLEKIKLALTAKLHEMEARVESIDEDLSREEDDDWQENAVESKDDEVLEEVGEATQDDILQVKLALSRLEEGKYGVCSKCDKAIAKERLKVLPYATRCVNCA